MTMRSLVRTITNRYSAVATAHASINDAIHHCIKGNCKSIICETVAGTQWLTALVLHSESANLKLPDHLINSHMIQQAELWHFHWCHLQALMTSHPQKHAFLTITQQCSILTGNTLSEDCANV